MLIAYSSEVKENIVFPCFLTEMMSYLSLKPFFLPKKEKEDMK